MKLYHFSSGDRLRGIARYGLTVGGVPTRSLLERSQVGVWLTTSESPVGQGFDDFLEDKRFRLAVDIAESDPRLARWAGWAAAHASSDVVTDLREATSHLGPSGVDDWFVYFGCVAVDCITGVEDVKTGAAVSDWQTIWPESDSHRGVPYWRRDAWNKKIQKEINRAILRRGSELGLI